MGRRESAKAGITHALARRREIWDGTVMSAFLFTIRPPLAGVAATARGKQDDGSCRQGGSAACGVGVQTSIMMDRWVQHFLPWTALWKGTR